MGRVKLKIKRLESASNRQVTYSKRRNGILKKAKELLILCDIDIILLMFSPTGKPTLFLGEHSNIEEVLAKIFQLTPQERAKRKLESLEALKKTFKKLDHDVNIHDFLGSSTHSVAELSTQVTMMQAQFMDVHKRLSCWSNAHKIDNIEHLRQLEDSLRESLNRILMEKESFVKPPRMPLECTSQFPHRMHLPLMMGGVQESQSVSWLHSNENQHMLLSSQPSFLPQSKKSNFHRVILLDKVTENDRYEAHLLQVTEIRIWENEVASLQQICSDGRVVDAEFHFLHNHRKKLKIPCAYLADEVFEIG
ncbi:agamous-like MADS-box protein AGL65 isoform X2 [Actinidia eriantha]|uniref:agamous-like MADS-box protein AGL65 isoform X2 n=1 Tax=Actinidia eriantha TaxID=165200 RepID=UPI0025825AAD|nr:agamous-like MADS-box protein AGL65 isoform X2 [Actinidia eriantha]